MEFEKYFEGAVLPEVKEKIGVMSIDVLNRQWTPVAVEADYLIAKSKDGDAYSGDRDQGFRRIVIADSERS